MRTIEPGGIPIRVAAILAVALAVSLVMGVWLVRLGRQPATPPPDREPARAAEPAPPPAPAPAPPAAAAPPAVPPVRAPRAPEPEPEAPPPAPAPQPAAAPPVPVPAPPPIRTVDPVMVAHAEQLRAARTCSSPAPTTDRNMRIIFRYALVTEGGQVRADDVELVGTDLVDISLVNCVLDQVAEARWPAPGAPPSRRLVQDIITVGELAAR